MPTNITIDNVSPLINYQPVGAWSEGNTSDGSMNLYSDGTFTLSTDSGASATLSFNGTGVWLFGAKRGNHGLYNVTLDGVVFTGNGLEADPGSFQTALYSNPNLENKLHTVTITNAGTTVDRRLDFLDIDYITWETESQEAIVTIIQDSDPRFSYQPQSAWDTNISDSSQYFGRSGHETYTLGASVTLSFTGDFVEIYGIAGPTTATYTVQVDGGSSSTYNGTKYAFHSQLLMYYADNLGAGEHTIKITNQPVTENQGLFINYARVSAPNADAPANGGSHSSSLSGGAIAGIVIGSLVAISIFAGIFIWRRRNGRPFEKRAPNVSQHFSTVPEITPYMNPHSTPSHSSYPLSPRSYDSSQPTAGYLNHQPLTSRINHETHGGRQLPRKGAPLQLPSTANESQSTDIVAGSDAQATHNVVDQPRDTGPIPSQGEMPPPDYTHATES